MRLPNDQAEGCFGWPSRASASCIEHCEDPRPGGDVVSSLVHSSMWQYAVISVRSEPCCEQLVIAYPDEKTLRDLLTPQSILGLGYSSHEEAQANVDRWKTTAYLVRREVTAILVTATRSLKRFVADHELLRGGFDLAQMWRIIRDLLQHSFAIAIVVFYSKNVLSTAIRVLISF